MTGDDYIRTIDSDDEVDVTTKTPTKTKGSSAKEDVTVQDALNPDFTFDLTGDVYADVLAAGSNLTDLVKGSKHVCDTTQYSVYTYKYLELHRTQFPWMTLLHEGN